MNPCPTCSQSSFMAAAKIASLHEKAPAFAQQHNLQRVYLIQRLANESYDLTGEYDSEKHRLIDAKIFL